MAARASSWRRGPALISVWVMVSRRAQQPASRLPRRRRSPGSAALSVAHHTLPPRPAPRRRRHGDGRAPSHLHPTPTTLRPRPRRRARPPGGRRPRAAHGRRVHAQKVWLRRSGRGKVVGGVAMGALGWGGAGEGAARHAARVPAADGAAHSSLSRSHRVRVRAAGDRPAAVRAGRHVRPGAHGKGERRGGERGRLAARRDPPLSFPSLLSPSPS